MLVVILSYALAIAVTHFFITKRQRWAWVIGTILQFNPILWVINGFYARNRWAEFSGDSALASDSSLSAVGHPPSVNDSSQGHSQDAESRGYYEVAWDELERGNFDKGVWAQAFAEAEGNEEKAKAIYLKARSREMSRQAEEQIAAQEREKCPYCGGKVEVAAALCGSCGKILPDRRAH